MASVYPIVAMKEAGVGIAVVCMTKWYVVMNNGLQLPVTDWLDKDGQPCREDDEPRYYEFGAPDVGFAVGDLDCYEMPSWKDH